MDKRERVGNVATMKNSCTSKIEAGRSQAYITRAASRVRAFGVVSVLKAGGMTGYHLQTLTESDTILVEDGQICNVVKREGIESGFLK